MKPLNPIDISDRFRLLYGMGFQTLASAPGRLEVLGNHTDYNGGLTLSCAVNFRCYAAIAPRDSDEARLASTMFGDSSQSFPLSNPIAPKGRWENYILGLLKALQDRGVDVPGFSLLVHSQVPRSAGVSSSAALEMAVITALDSQLRLGLPPLDLARIGQAAESSAVGARTGLLDQLSSLLGRRDHLLQIDFESLQTNAIAMPSGWCFVAVDSGVKHDLTKEYNDRRASCESAARAMGVDTLRTADRRLFEDRRPEMSSEAASCCEHILGEIERVREAGKALSCGDMDHLGELMFASHRSSQVNFRNSCQELDELVDFAHADPRCVGARLSGGGFGGISIHLVRQRDAAGYRRDLLDYLSNVGGDERWSAVCVTDDGAKIHG